MDLILASGSPRRRELLHLMGLENFRVVISEVDERVDLALSPAALVEELSRRKALAVRQQEGSDPIIIAADTVVAMEGQILGKPADEAEARKMLDALSGRCHQVYTGITVRQGERALTCHESTSVHFRSLSQEEISCYLATGESLDKAGAYGIQGCGALLVARIEGDYYNVVGLPVVCLAGLLRQFGVDCLKLCARTKRQ